MTPRVRAALATLSFLALTAGARPAAAQGGIRETQVPLAPELGIFEITPELDRELIFARDVRGEFVAFRLFRLADGTMVGELSWIANGVLEREREVFSNERLAAERSALATRLAERGQSRAFDRSGRSGLVIAQSLLGLGFYGWAVPVGFDIDSGRGAVAAYLLTSGLSFYLPYALTRRASVSVAERNATIWGATRGIVHGSMLGGLLEGTDDPDDFSDEGADVRMLSALGMSVAEAVLGYHAVDAAGASEGEVAFWGAIGDLGIPTGLALAYLSGLAEQETCGGDFCTVDDFGAPAGYAVALGVSLAAPLLAHRSGQGADYTIGDARALRSFALLGAQTVLPLAWAALDVDDEGDPGKGLIASLVAGGAAGVWLGNRVLRNHALSGGDGALVLAGHVAGGLGALGITYLLDSDDGDTNELLYITTSSLGSLAGALLTFRAVSDRAPRTASLGGLTLELSPAGALLPVVAEGSPRRQSAPFLTLRF